MQTTQLRRYTIRPDAHQDFVNFWRQNVTTLRRDAGFTIEFAVMDEQASEFIWAVSAPGDKKAFQKLEATYNASPTRTAVFANIPGWVTAVQISFIQPAY
ncbi:hypothetical protein [Arthrobacter mangrovi]|uniref:NIPSNAP domain-containing protein n=1 Tax=Arthrobacter mangrovi TaxID=2966350 RepID=A0ABQ5MZS7_9MICC|nr:hypothetical protein [Arthrobacter mangrovi]GLB69500.1 hypothetical protein AHIS1636_39450 [Arthrobacter mangrovi]